MPVNKIIKTRRDSSTNWTSVNPVLALGEAGLETDTNFLKYGDGVTLWNSLPYFAAPQTSIVGISGTKGQYNTSLTDGDFLFVGDVIAYTDEQAQDAVGNILVDSSTIDFTYDDSIPNIIAIVKPNSIDSSHLSNSINVSEFVNDSDYATEAYVDSKIPSNYSKVVYVDSNNPNTATIFDVNNPPTVNDDTLKTDVNNLYVGLNASTWVYNSTSLTYITEPITSGTSNFYLGGTAIDAGGNKITSIERTGTVGGAPATASNHFVTKAQHDTKGDMTTSTAQNVSGVKTFLAGMFGLRNTANTFTSFFASAVTASRTWILPDKSGTIAMTSDIPWVSSSIHIENTNSGNVILKTSGKGFVGSDGASGMYFNDSDLRFVCYGNSEFKFNPIYLNSNSAIGSTRNVIGFVNQLVNPTSGNMNYNFLNLSPTINQTGGASGIVRSIYINPTLTSAYDYRALEITGGKILLHKVNLRSYTFSNLPLGQAGDKSFITDALSPVFLSIAVGGGTVFTPVFHNGTNWIVG